VGGPECLSWGLVRGPHENTEGLRPTYIEFMWIDTHCHLAGEEYDADRVQVFQRAREAGIEGFIVIGAGDGLGKNADALSLCEKEVRTFAAIGIHPHDASKVDDSGAYLKKLKEWAKHPKVVAIGEIGLDYHYKHSLPDVQQKRFREQIELAGELNFPISIHSREAWADTLKILKEAGVPSKKGVFHCFGGNLEEAHQALELDFYISISGIVTFKKAENLIHVVSEIPLEKMVIETDAPFLAPVPHRGKRNEPAFVALVGEKIAEIKKLPLEKVAKQIGQNTRELFHGIA